jgi:serine/threonine-protein kinase
MAAIFSAIDRHGARVAVKVLVPHLWEDQQARACFELEIQMAGALPDDHFVRVLEQGTLEGGAPFMVMELLEGEDLRSRVRRHGILPQHETIDLMLQACGAVGQMHLAGIVHLDLKPSNLFVVREMDRSFTLKVLDFGVAQCSIGGVEHCDRRVNKVGTLFGSPPYASPEQYLTANDVDGRSDIWSLGVTLYELFSDRLPFVGQSLPEIRRKVVGEAPIPIRRTCPLVPVAVEKIIARCLQKDRRDRFSSMLELGDALIAVQKLSGADDSAAPAKMGNLRNVC